MLHLKSVYPKRIELTQLSLGVFKTLSSTYGYNYKTQVT